MEKMRDLTLGFIDTPAQGRLRPRDVFWCADNGAFSDRFDEAKWWKFLERNAYDAGTCLFATAPDVVGNAAATLARSLPWLPKIRELGYPAALVAQNGIERLEVPWDSFDALFIGGCVECPDHGPAPKAPRTGRGAWQKFFCPVCSREIFDWKLGPAVRELVTEAKRRGKHVHAGRVNSGRRYRYFRDLGCDSADGTFLIKGAEQNLPRLLRWLA